MKENLKAPIRNGPGKLTYNDGYSFHSRGEIIGSGVVEGIWKEGELDYEGDVDENGKPHGRGKGMFSSNNVYEGEWKNGLRHGKGTDESDNGSSYDGQWKHDKRQEERQGNHNAHRWERGI